MCSARAEQRSKRNRGAMSEETFLLLTEAVKGNPGNRMEVKQFEKDNKSFIFENCCKARPKFTYDESTLYRVQGGQKKEVLYESKAREIAQHIHRPPGRACRKSSVRAVVEEFQSRYFCKGIDNIVRETLRNCDGTCKRLQALKTRNPPPKLIRTYSIMERVQVDLTEMYGPKSPFKETVKHGYRLILSVLDCFSKYCWLIPLSNKKAETVAGALQHIFVEYGCPELLHSDNGGEFIAEVIQHLCKLMNISQIHGAPRYPQSQGQVESLNKKVKSALRHRLLDFKPQEMADVWPFLLPEISQVINNTWHATIKCTPFEVFFGRPSRLFIGSTGSCIAVAPSDKWLLLMASTGQLTGKEKTSGGNDGSSSDTDDWSDSDDSHQGDIKTSPKDDINVEELLASLHQTSQSRLQIYHNVRENTEARYYQNYLAYIRKIRPQKFCVGDTVMFRFPEQHGLVVLPNIEGVISEVMSCDYYRVSYTTVDGSKGSTVLYSSLMVGTTTHSPLKPQDSSEMLESDILTKIYLFTNTLRETLPNDSVHLPQDLDPLLDEVMQHIGVEHSDLKSPTALLDFFCYSLDLSFLSVTTLDHEYSCKCKQSSQVIQHLLRQKSFQYYLSGIHAWESSRSLNPIHLEMAISKGVLPYFIGASHSCVECINAMKPCQHPCCLEWYMKAGIKCGMLKETDSEYQCSRILNSTTTSTDTKVSYSQLSSKQNSSPSSVSQIFTANILKSSLPKKRKKCATKTRTSSKKTHRSQPQNKCMPKMKSKIKAACRSQPKQYMKFNTEPPKLRPVADFKAAYLYQRKSISTLPMTLSKRRLSAILNELSVEASNALHVFKERCTSCLERWTELSWQEKNNISANIRYVASVIGVHDINYASELQSITSPSMPYLQLQGDSNLCGLCALNNLYQSEKFTIYCLNQIADGLWLSHWTDLDMNPTEPVQAMRSQLGDYSIDVLDAAVNSYGHRLMNITSSIRSFIEVHADGEYLLSNPKLLQQHILQQVPLPAALILKQQTYHYICILFDVEQNVWCLDSRGSQPLILPAIRLHAVMKKEFKCSISTATLHVFTSDSEVGCSVQQDSTIMCGSDADTGEDSTNSVNLSDCDQDLNEEEVGTYGESSNFSLQKDKQRCNHKSIISTIDTVDLTSDSKENTDAQIDHNKPQSRIALTLCGLHCYEPNVARIFRNEWIDSEVISFYFNILQGESDLAVREARSRRRLVLLPTYFYVRWASFLRGMEKGKSTTGRVRYKKGKQTVLNHPVNWIEEEDPDKISAILVPVNIAQSHWILCVMDFQEACITCYDPLGYTSHQSVCDKLRLLVPELYKQKKGATYSVWDWSIKTAVNFPQQRNSSDCGIFVCKIADCIVKKKKFNFEPDSLSLRCWLLNQLLSSPQKLPAVKGDETVILELAHAAEISWGVEICIAPDQYHYTDDDSSDDEKMEIPETFQIDEYDILEPTYHYQKEEIQQCQEQFRTFRRRRQKLLKQHVVDTYRTISIKDIESQLPGGLTLQSVRGILTSMEEMLRGLCDNPKRIQWVQHIKQHLPVGTPVTDRLVKDLSSLWPLDTPGLRDEVQFFIVAISEDVSPLSPDHSKMMRRAQFELIPEVIYNITYKEAAGCYIAKKLPSHPDQ